VKKIASRNNIFICRTINITNKWENEKVASQRKDLGKFSDRWHYKRLKET
jgi:hypothetical protein